MTNLPVLMRPYQDDIDRAVSRVIKSGVYIGGPEVEAFENEWSDYLGVGYTVGVGNGTDALAICLRAAGVTPGDYVATVALSASATAVAIQMVGARPLWVDIDSVTMTMSAESLGQVLESSSRSDLPVKAIIPVHLYGYPADMNAIMEVAEKYRVVVIEDCAQAHGATIAARRCGTITHMAAFSFYPTKNLGCLGDGGAVCTHDAVLAARVRMIAQYGWRRRNVSEMGGVNSRLDPLQAAILRVRLAHLDNENQRRREIAQQYYHVFRELPLQAPVEKPGYRHVFHQFVLRTDDRQGLMDHMAARDIECQVHYPVPIHRQPAFDEMKGLLPTDLACTEVACRTVLSIPVQPALTNTELDTIQMAVSDFFTQTN